MTDLAALALGLADFIDSSIPYHACATAAARLDAAGFVRLDERAAWEALPERVSPAGWIAMAWASRHPPTPRRVSGSWGLTPTTPT